MFLIYISINIKILIKKCNKEKNRGNKNKKVF